MEPPPSRRRPLDPAHAAPYATQLARFRARERRLDGACALLFVGWLVIVWLWDVLDDWRLLAALAGTAAIGAAWFALRRGNGRVADAALAALLRTPREP